MVQALPLAIIMGARIALLFAQPLLLQDLETTKTKESQLVDQYICSTRFTLQVQKPKRCVCNLSTILSIGQARKEGLNFFDVQNIEGLNKFHLIHLFHLLEHQKRWGRGGSDIAPPPPPGSLTPPSFQTRMCLQHLPMSVCWSVGPLVRPSVTLSDFQAASVSGRPT